MVIYMPALLSCAHFWGAKRNQGRGCGAGREARQDCFGYGTLTFCTFLGTLRGGGGESLGKGHTGKHMRRAKCQTERWKLGANNAGKPAGRLALHRPEALRLRGQMPERQYVGSFNFFDFSPKSLERPSKIANIILKVSWMSCNLLMHR